MLPIYVLSVPYVEAVVVCNAENAPAMYAMLCRYAEK